MGERRGADEVRTSVSLNNWDYGTEQEHTDENSMELAASTYRLPCPQQVDTAHNSNRNAAETEHLTLHALISICL